MRWLLLLVLLAGCGKEVCRVALTDAGTGSTTVALKKGQELALWTSLDVDYKGTFAPSYTIKLSDGKTTVGTATCNPFDVSVKTSSVETHIGDNNSVRYNGKMRCSLPVAPADGSYTVDVTLTFPTRPPALAVKDMSFFGKL